MGSDKPNNQNSSNSDVLEHTITTETTYYQIPPQYEVVFSDEECVFSNGDRHVTIAGKSLPLVEAIFPGLKKGSTHEELQASVDVNDEALQQLLSVLETNDLVEKTSVTLPKSASEADAIRFHYHHQTNIEHAATAPLTLDAPIMIIQPDFASYGGIDHLDLSFSSEQTTHETFSEENAAEASVLLTVTFGHAPQTNLSYEALADEYNTPILFVRLFLDRILVGPFLIPGETTTFEAAYRREKTTTDDPTDEIQIEAELDGCPGFPVLEEHEVTIRTYVESELRSYTGQVREPVTATTVIRHNLHSLEVEHIPILRLPDRAPDARSEWSDFD